MKVHHVLSLGLALTVCAAAAIGCGGEGSGSAMSGATTAKPAMSGTAMATSTATAMAPATATAMATATATAMATAAPAAVIGIAAGEIVGASCDESEKSSECGEAVVKSDGEKPKLMEAMKKLCKDGKVLETACAADKIVGTCRVGKDIINHYYSSGGKAYTADTAKKACDKSHGKWITP